MDKHSWVDIGAKAFGFFIYMLLERKLGQTESGSVIGLISKLFAKKGKEERMNKILKILLKEVVGLVAMGEAIVAKDWSKVFTILVAEGVELPTLIENWKDIKPELEALLADPSTDADLLAYTVSLVAGESAKAQAIITASADLVLSNAIKVSALINAIKT